jgi:carbamate kinase
VPEKRIFLAIGGNSLIKSKELRTVQDQHKAIQETIVHFADLIEEGYQLAISHGNGPQVGFILRRSELARRAVGLHPVPLVNIVADTQGAIGYQIQQALGNELAVRGISGQCVTVVTQVVVDRDDPGFGKPSKPIGEFFDEGRAEEIRRDYPDWTMAEDAGRGYRRMVPSPEPLEVVEQGGIESLLREGYHVVAVGGGGIPVIRTERGLAGVDAVIDKDLASSLLANLLGIDLMIISTAIEKISLHFGKPGQKEIDRMTAREAGQYMAEGHFAPGSMLPKIEAALRFLRGGGKKVIITAPEFIKDAVVNGRGTHIVP